MTKCKKLAKAWASSSQKVRAWLARLGSETDSKPSLAQLGLESRLDFRAKLGSGSEGSGISELGSARARTYIKFRAGLELGLEKLFLGSIHPGLAAQLVNKEDKIESIIDNTD